ncbi:hypothetical protein [Marinoscillum furvescens]|nr:hypothetical protein [Marinoscillum furvescens]
MKTQAELLLEEYKKVRNIDLSLDQFTYILNLYPSLIVCMCDGVLDKEEWDGVLRLAKGLALEYGDGLNDEEMERLEQSFRTEFRYLLDNIEKWQKKFLNTLRNNIQDSRSDKEFVMESMYLFANAADGISEVEQETIQMLTERLALEH